jgi:hypothetical protein
MEFFENLHGVLITFEWWFCLNAILAMYMFVLCQTLFDLKKKKFISLVFFGWEVRGLRLFLYSGLIKTGRGGHDV